MEKRGDKNQIRNKVIILHIHKEIEKNREYISYHARES
jgi:hypothetical protein